MPYSVWLFRDQCYGSVVVYLKTIQCLYIYSVMLCLNVLCSSGIVIFWYSFNNLRIGFVSDHNRISVFILCPKMQCSFDDKRTILISSYCIANKKVLAKNWSTVKGYFKFFFFLQHGWRQYRHSRWSVPWPLSLALSSLS